MSSLATVYDYIYKFSGVLKKFEEEDLDDLLRKRLKDSSELPGALWHIYSDKDADKIKEFLQKVSYKIGCTLCRIKLSK